MSYFEWPAEDVTRAPCRVMSDPEIYAQEQTRIFRGPTWSYLCLEAELPEAGSFRTTWVGDTPVLVTRDRDGGIYALVNRCAHKGAMLCVEAGGNKPVLTCPNHAWSYDLKGNLCGVAFQHGVNGQGGMPADFDFSAHGLERLRSAAFRGLVFGTFSPAAEPLETYLGPGMTAHLGRVFHKPVEVLGYQHQSLQNNWKLYMYRPTMDGGITVEHGGWHSINYSKGATPREGEYEGTCIGSVSEGAGIEDDPTLLARRLEFAEGITVAIQFLFPSCVSQQIYNTLALRYVVPRGPRHCELHWTFFGYRDDDAELRRMRLVQVNLIGPAGYVSIGDGVLGEYVQHGVSGVGMEASAVMEIGGREIESSTGSRATGAAMRGFWTGYRSLMGF